MLKTIVGVVALLALLLGAQPAHANPNQIDQTNTDQVTNVLTDGGGLLAQGIMPAAVAGDTPALRRDAFMIGVAELVLEQSIAVNRARADYEVLREILRANTSRALTGKKEPSLAPDQRRRTDE